MSSKISKLRLDIYPIKDEYFQIYPVAENARNTTTCIPDTSKSMSTSISTSISTTCSECNRVFTDEYYHNSHFCWPKPIEDMFVIELED